MQVLEGLCKGITEDDLRGKFVSGLVVSGLPPETDGSFYFLRALHDAESRGYVTAKEVGWGNESQRFYQLELAGQRFAESAGAAVASEAPRQEQVQNYPSSGKHSDSPERKAGLAADETSQLPSPTGAPQRWYLFFRASASQRLIDGEGDEDMDADAMQSLQQWRLFDCIDDLTAEEVSLLLNVLDADQQGVLAADDGPQLNGEIRGSLYEFRAVCEQDAIRDQVEYIRLRRRWSELENGYEAFGCNWTAPIATNHGLWESSRRTADQIRSMRSSAAATSSETAANTAKTQPDEKKRTAPNETYILCRWLNKAWHPILCTGELTDEESQRLIELLHGEYTSPPYQFKSVKACDYDWKQLIEIRRQWHAIEPCLGEFDFGLWDVRLPEEWKVYVQVNYTAAEYLTEIEGLRQQGEGNGGAGSGRPRLKGEIVNSSFEQLKQIADEIRCLPRAFGTWSEDGKTLLEGDQWINSEALTKQGGELFAEAIDLGAFSGEEYAELRVHVRNIKMDQPDSWAPAVFGIASKYICPEIWTDEGGVLATTYSKQCAAYADAIEAEIKRMEAPSAGLPTAKTGEGERDGHATRLPPAPSSLAELPEWIQSARELLRDQEDLPIQETGIAYAVRKQFLEHIERLCPFEWSAWHHTFQPQKFQAVRDLVAMMAWVGQSIGGKPPASTIVTGFATQPAASSEQIPAVTESARHSEDFCSVVWFGTEYRFTKTQAACIRVLWEAWENKTPTLSEETILAKAGSQGSRLRDVFKSKKDGPHMAWGTMIVEAGKGRFQLQEPDRTQPPEKPQVAPR
jgi:hypothetical protein